MEGASPSVQEDLNDDYYSSRWQPTTWEQIKLFNPQYNLSDSLPPLFRSALQRSLACMANVALAHASSFQHKRVLIEGTSVFVITTCFYIGWLTFGGSVCVHSTKISNAYNFAGICTSVQAATVLYRQYLHLWRIHRKRINASRSWPGPRYRWRVSPFPYPPSCISCIYDACTRRRPVI